MSESKSVFSILSQINVSDKYGSLIIIKEIEPHFTR